MSSLSGLIKMAVNKISSSPPSLYVVLSPPFQSGALQNVLLVQNQAAKPRTLVF